jgi:hypothetical protein
VGASSARHGLQRRQVPINSVLSEIQTNAAGNAGATKGLSGRQTPDLSSLLGPLTGKPSKEANATAPAPAPAADEAGAAPEALRKRHPQAPVSSIIPDIQSNAADDAGATDGGLNRRQELPSASLLPELPTRKVNEVGVAKEAPKRRQIPDATSLLGALEVNSPKEETTDNATKTAKSGLKKPTYA